MDLSSLVVKNRSYRRFDESHPVTEETLKELVDLARQTASAGNQQPLRYLLSCTPESNAKVFETLGWAASLSDWPGPDPGERPSGYIVLLHSKDNESKWVYTDAGIATQTMLLSAVDRGLGGVMFGTIRKNKLRESFDIPEDLEILLILAIGKPVETVVLEDASAGESITYYRDADMTHHVPKRKLEDVIIGIR